MSYLDLNDTMQIKSIGNVTINLVMTEKMVDENFLDCARRLKTMNRIIGQWN